MSDGNGQGPGLYGDSCNGGGYFKVPNKLVRARHVAKMTPAELRVYLALRVEANPGDSTSAGIDFLGEAAGVASANKVRAAIQGLVRRGLVEVLRVGGGRGVRTRYRLLEPPNESAEGRVKRKQVPLRTTKPVPRGVENRSPGGPAINNSLPRTPNQELLLPAAAAPPASDRAKPPTSGRRETVFQQLSRQHAPFRQMTDYWCELKRRENPHYVFNKVEGPLISQVWKWAGENLLVAKGAMAAYFDDPRAPEGHPMKYFLAAIESYITRAANPRRATNGRRQIDRDRGFCQGPTELPREPIKLGV